MSNIIIDPFKFGGFHNTTTNTQSFNFDGSGDFLELPDDANWDFIDGSASSTDNEKHSFAFWLHRDSATGNFGIISKFNTGGANSYRHFYHSSGQQLLLDTYQGNNQYKRRIFSGQSNSDWQHHVWVHDGNPTGWKLFINGAEVSSSGTGGSASEMVNTASTVRIGNASGLQDLNGQMCQFMAWKGIELDLAAAKYLYASGAAMRNPTLAGSEGAGVYTQAQANGLLAWLPMDDTNGANDHSGSTHGTHNFTKNGNCDVTTGGGNVPF
tara:strand:+ start:1376 stop:2179 length:804 start_codon:yes stop_codon:yes gene_type:complete